MYKYICDVVPSILTSILVEKVQTLLIKIIKKKKKKKKKKEYFV